MDQMPDAAPTKTRIDQPEHRLSHWLVEELFERIILTDVPAWWTAVDHSVKMTNQSAEAKFNFENHRKWMGVRPHHLDTYVYQYPLYAQIELKFANTRDAAEKALTTGQRDTMAVLNRRGVSNGFAWSIRSCYDELRRIGFRLHGNAENIVREIEHRYAAAQMTAEMKKAAPKKKHSSKPRAAKPTAAQLRRFAGVRARFGAAGGLI